VGQRLEVFWDGNDRHFAGVADGFNADEV